MDDLHFDAVVGPRLVPVAVVDIMAVLKVHEGMPRDENGVSTVRTIRQLMQKYAPAVTGLELEYICAFGKHGQAVVSRYIQQLGVDVEVFERKVSTRVSEIERDIMRREKE